MNIYVGNLDRNVTEDELRQAFEVFGQVSSATVIKDKYTHESRGFGFVEMPTQSEGQAAITGLNDTELNGRALRVDQARDRADSRGGGRGGSGGGGGGRGGSGGGGRRSW